MNLGYKKFIRRFPIVSPLPFETFASRQIWKWKLCSSYFGFYGAKEIDVKSNGNARIRLNKNTSLGKKGTTLEVPLDFAIYNTVRIFGEWSKEVSSFLSAGLIKTCDESVAKKSVLLDIGANSGLITLQTLNMVRKKSIVIMFEPVANHREAIEYNLRNIISKHEIVLNDFGLGEENVVTSLFREKKNKGNTSIFKSLVPVDSEEIFEIQIKDTKAYFANLPDFDSYIIKCDTQGMDSIILSRIPEEIWKKVDRATIEIWATEEVIEADVQTLLGFWESSKYISWDSEMHESVDLQELKKFWLGKTGEFRDLFITRI